MTVAELIAKLQELPQDMPVRLPDADSIWCPCEVVRVEQLIGETFVALDQGP